jgi:CHAD domain-containing protein
VSYRLDLRLSVDDELRRCAGEPMTTAIGRLDDEDGDRVAAVHDARKSIKKTRAVLRLARRGVPAPARRREDHALRDAGRTLAAVRDADVLPATLDDLAGRCAGRLPAAAFAELRAALAVPQSSGANEGERAVAEGRSALEAVAGGIGSWPLERCDRVTVVRGAQATYREGRRAWRVARKNAGDEALHEWRKRVKDLWYHARLLRDLWPEAQSAYAHDAKRLATLLGDDHDLAMLAGRVAELAAGDLRAAGPGDIQALADERRAQLREEAAQVARRLYAESPSAFGHRLSRWASAL